MFYPFCHFFIECPFQKKEHSMIFECFSFVIDSNPINQTLFFWKEHHNPSYKKTNKQKQKKEMKFIENLNPSIKNAGTMVNSKSSPIIPVILKQRKISHQDMLSIANNNSLSRNEKISKLYDSEVYNPEKLKTRLRSLFYNYVKDYHYRIKYDDKNIEYILDYVIEKVEQGITDVITVDSFVEFVSMKCLTYFSIRKEMYEPYIRFMASALLIHRFHKKMNKDFKQHTEMLYNFKDPFSGKPSSFVSKRYYDFVMEHHEAIQKEINYDKDYLIDIFGYKTLQKSYVYRYKSDIFECPQHVFMRLSIAENLDNIESALENYRLLSDHFCMQGSASCINAGSNNQQFSSCVLTSHSQDSLEGIQDTEKNIALFSKNSAGIGCSITRLRARGKRIKGTNGETKGVHAVLAAFNAKALYVDQGGGKRKAAIAFYLEPWHYDIISFLFLKNAQNEEKLDIFNEMMAHAKSLNKITNIEHLLSDADQDDFSFQYGKDSYKARDLFFGLWRNKLFMERVRENDNSKRTWSLFSPDDTPDLVDLYGDAFKQRYEYYEKEGYAMFKLDARRLYDLMLNMQLEVGDYFMMEKDFCNEKSNQKNLGTITNTNLCTEIIQFNGINKEGQLEISQCNLASVALNKCVINHRFISGNYETCVPWFDFDMLSRITRHLVRMLNNTIDYNYYPVSSGELSNKKHRPIGIGVQGLADVFCLMGYPFESKAATILNYYISSCMYYSALDESCNISKEIATRTGKGKYESSYESFKGSPMDNGEFQFDMWGIKDPNDISKVMAKFSGDKKLKTDKYMAYKKTKDSWYRFKDTRKDQNCFKLGSFKEYAPNWNELRQKINQYGMINSLLIALMPTASTSQLLGNPECFEPRVKNVLVREVLSGSFTVMNEFMFYDLKRSVPNLGTKEMTDYLMKHKGSIQNNTKYPKMIREIYKTVHEMDVFRVLSLCVDRAIFVCQHQSINVYLPKNDPSMLRDVDMYMWENEMKGRYYTKCEMDISARDLSIDSNESQKNDSLVCRRDNPDCESCSS